jgi:hypothetical protein
MIRNYSTLGALLLGAAPLAAGPLALAQESPDSLRPTNPPTRNGDLDDVASKLAPPSALPRGPFDVDVAAGAASSALPHAPSAFAPKFAAPEPPVGGRVQPAIDTVLYDTTAAPGQVLARGRNWKAEFGPTGLTYIPVLGRNAPRNFPTSFNLASVRSGGEPVDFRSASVSQRGATVTLDRGTLREAYHLDADVIEQTFVFDALPTLGDLVVEVAVDSTWHVIATDEALRFVGETFGELTYGRAYVYDANGVREEIARLWTGTSIELIVPATFLATAAFPVTIDPPLGNTLQNSFGGPDDSNADLAFDASSGKFWLTWQDFTSATDADVYVTQFTPGGTQGTTVIVDTTTEYWETPAVAAAPTAERVLVVASTTTNGPGTSIANIEGRLVDTSASTQAGATFEIDQLTGDCVRPDVGGQWWTGSSEAEFCVVWERVHSTTDHDIHARRVQATGSPEGSTIFVSNSGTANDFAPAISASWGDPELFGDFWNVAWIRDADGNGTGRPIASRIYFDGTSNGATEFEVNATQLARNVSITSTLDDELVGTSERPFLVAFERSVNGGDVFVTVCTQNVAHSTSTIGTMEDFDLSLPQIEPSIATDGTSFFLTYSELFFAGAGSNDFDVFMVSGNISELVTGGSIALAERHVGLAETFNVERASSTATRFDGGGGTDDGFVVWEQRSGTNGAQLFLRELDARTTENSTQQAVGRQYCAANAHADSGSGGRETSWMWLRGDQRTGSTHRLFCEDTKRDAFAYFICSLTPGSVNLPGGSAGRLCLSGAIGRLVGGQILTTGSNGSISIDFSPGNLPSPSGPVAAAAGETWHFQCWHRDIAPGSVSTSNFSNAVAVTFQP